VENVIAWKNGFFHFDDDDMGTIMRKLARWYNVKVTYEGSVPAGHYTGIISRQTNLSKVLKMLELSGVRFKLQGREILVASS
jgi:ferric-dicitrate binding protein FerR (iron transport regulator)